MTKSERQRILNKFRESFDLQGYLEKNGVERISQSGNNLIACCPFHSESHPSWGIHKETFVYNCFSCHASGDLFALMHHFGDDPKTLLSGTVGVSGDDLRDLERGLKSLDRPQENEREEVISFPKDVWGPKSKGFVRYAGSYLKRKRISRELCYRFGLRVCKKGPMSKTKTGRKVYPFQHRLLVPIRDHLGRYLFYTGRASRSTQTKWLYPLGSKQSLVVFNLHNVLSVGKAVVVEGVADVIKLTQYGIPAVALLTTQCSDSQMILLSKLEEVILAFDGDIAGRIATKKVMKKISGKGFTVKAIYLPKNKDPDEISEERWSYLLRMASVSKFDRIA